MSASNDLETKLLNVVFNATAYAGQSTLYVQLHTGDPGEAGTSNVASEPTRKSVTFGNATGTAPTQVANDSAPSWTNYPGSVTENVNYVSLWDAVTAGNCVCSGAIGTNNVNPGDTVTFPIGTLIVTLD